MLFEAPASVSRLLRASRGGRGHGAAGNARRFLVAVTHPKNSYSSRTPCSSLLPLLNAQAAASGKQSHFTRKSTNHNKPSEGKAATPKMASNLPSAADSSPQAVPANKQVSLCWEASVRCPRGSRRPWCPDETTCRAGEASGPRGASPNSPGQSTHIPEALFQADEVACIRLKEPALLVPFKPHPSPPNTPLHPPHSSQHPPTPPPPPSPRHGNKIPYLLTDTTDERKPGVCFVSSLNSQLCVVFQHKAKVSSNFPVFFWAFGKESIFQNDIGNSSLPWLLKIEASKGQSSFFPSAPPLYA